MTKQTPSYLLVASGAGVLVTLLLYRKLLGKPIVTDIKENPEKTQDEDDIFYVILRQYMMPVVKKTNNSEYR